MPPPTLATCSARSHSPPGAGGGQVRTYALWRAQTPWEGQCERGSWHRRDGSTSLQWRRRALSRGQEKQEAGLRWIWGSPPERKRGKAETTYSTGTCLLRHGHRTCTMHVARWDSHPDREPSSVPSLSLYSCGSYFFSTFGVPGSGAKVEIHHRRVPSLTSPVEERDTSQTVNRKCKST